MKQRTTTHVYLEEDEQMDHYESLDVRNEGKKHLFRIVSVGFDPIDPDRYVIVYGRRVYTNGSGMTQSRPVYGLSAENREKVKAVIARATRILKEDLG